MPNLYSSLNYRSYLKASYEQRKEDDSYFSYRYIENKTGLNASYTVKLFQEKVH